VTHHAKMLGVTMIGVLFALSGVGGVAVGGVAAQTGVWLIVLGLTMMVLGWRRRRL
jgi:hypothetical protein